MQVSVYLNSSVAKRLDREAKKQSRSRSRYVQALLEKVLMKKEEKTLFDEVFGILNEKEASSLLQTVRKNRINSRRFF